MTFDKQRATSSSVCQCCRLVEWHMCTWQERTYYLFVREYKQHTEGLLCMLNFVCELLLTPSGDHRLSSSSAWTLGCILVEGTCTLYKLLYVYVYILALLQAWSRTPFHQEVRNLPLQAWMVLRSMEVYMYMYILLTSTCIIVWLETCMYILIEFECVQKELCL